MVQQGIIKTWLEKGYGFIQPDDGGNDVFCHINVVENADRLHPGWRVSFQVVPDRRTGRMQAENVHVLG